MRYLFIEEHRNQYRIRMMCRVLGVSRGGFYAWRGRPASLHSREDQYFTVRIRTAFKESRCNYGSPRIYRELQAEGVSCGKKRVARLMRQEGLCGGAPRPFQITTNSSHQWPVAQNLLDRRFNVDGPNLVWCSDITYISTSQGWLYLAVVIDLYSRRVVGWAMGETIDKELVRAAFEMAQGSRTKTVGLKTVGLKTVGLKTVGLKTVGLKTVGLLHHSDRGSQYASRDYQDLLLAADVLCSMSRKGNCWDNAVAESFFATLKRELVYKQRFATRQEARQEIFDYIEVFYNRKRRHSTLGYLSPKSFEDSHLEQFKEAA